MAPPPLLGARSSNTSYWQTVATDANVMLVHRPEEELPFASATGDHNMIGMLKPPSCPYYRPLLTMHGTGVFFLEVGSRIDLTIRQLVELNRNASLTI